MKNSVLNKNFIILKLLNIMHLSFIKIKIKIIKIINFIF